VLPWVCLQDDEQEEPIWKERGWPRTIRTVLKNSGFLKLNFTQSEIAEELA
jgi:hypothetical protein